MNTAKKIRLSRILNPESNKSVIIPIDHGLTMGPICGLESTKKMAHWIKHSGMNAIIAHKGIIVRLAERNLLSGKGIILHLNGMNALATSPDNKEMLSSIETAVDLGVDAVSLQINFTGENDSSNWKQLGKVVDQASKAGFPVLTMLYDKVSSEAKTKRLRQLLRVAVELGTDAIKIAMPSSTEEISEILDPICDDAMIFLAGGELAKPELLLRQIEDAMQLGITGVCMGRNVFANPHAEIFLKNLSSIVHSHARALPLIREAIHA